VFCRTHNGITEKTCSKCAKTQSVTLPNESTSGKAHLPDETGPKHERRRPRLSTKLTHRRRWLGGATWGRPTPGVDQPLARTAHLGKIILSKF